MPLGEPDRSRGTCAEDVGAYVFRSFRGAIVCNGPAPIARGLRLLTVREYRATIADLLGTTAVAPPAGAPPTGPAAPCGQTTFVYDAHGRVLKTVHVAGSFNAWPATIAGGGWALALQPSATWSTTHAIPSGGNQYKLVLNESEWITDPANPKTASDGLGGNNSLLVLLCSEISDGNTHSHDDMPFLLGGGGGGTLRTGRVLDFGGRRHSDLLGSIAHAMGDPSPDLRPGRPETLARSPGLSAPAVGSMSEIVAPSSSSMNRGCRIDRSQTFVAFHNKKLVQRRASWVSRDMLNPRHCAVWALAFGSLLLCSSSALAAPPGAGEMEEEKLEDEDPEKAARLHIWDDNVFGFGRTPVVTSAPIRFGSAQTVHSLESLRFSSQNADIGVSYEFINDLAIGIEFPITHITYDSALGNRSVTAIGNLELNAEYVRVIAKHVALVPSLEIALPTAQGEEEPTKAEVDADPGKDRDLTSLDRFSAQRAAAAVRGWEENHLFAPHRLGIVPRIGLLFEFGKLEIEPYAKIGALVSTRSAPFEGDVVLALRGGYRLHHLVDAGVRVWTNIPIGGSLPEDESPVGVMEPQIRGHFGQFLPVIGVVIPFAGPLSHPENVGVRIALAAHF